MSDDTILNTGVGGDIIRNLDRGSLGVKTQVIQLDLGGSASNPEKLIVAGQQTMANSVPVAIASNQSALPVTGTFFQATQPVSGTFWPAIQPVSFTMPPLVASAAVIGAVTQSGTWTFTTASPARVMKVYSADNFSATVSEAMLTLNEFTNGDLTDTDTTFGVTPGKKLRITALAMSMNSPGTPATGATCSLRMKSTGSTTATSSMIATVGVGMAGTLVAQLGDSNSVAIPDGIEFSGSMQFGISQRGVANAGFKVTLIGYEY